MVETLLAEGRTVRLNEKTYPNCILHRSDPSDVARTESVTFICTRNQEDAGPTNNWMAPAEAKESVGRLFAGSMAGRTMYVVPYLMGPANSPICRAGVEITDSAYVVASMRIMARMGKVAMDRIGSSNDFVPGLHSLGDLHPDRRFILHFPEEKRTGQGDLRHHRGSYCEVRRLQHHLGRPYLHWHTAHRLLRD